MNLHYFTFDIDLRSGASTKCCPVSSTSYDLCTCKFEVAMSNGLGGVALTIFT